MSGMRTCLDMYMTWENVIHCDQSVKYSFWNVWNARNVWNAHVTAQLVCVRKRTCIGIRNDIETKGRNGEAATAPKKLMKGSHDWQS